MTSIGGGPSLAPPTPLAPVSGGGGTAPPTPTGPVAGTDLAAALTQLQQAVDQLAAVVGAMQGAGAIGGGPGGSGSGCGCGGGSPMQAQPAQYGAAGAPEAPPPPPPATSPGDDTGGSVRQKIVAAAEAELAKGVKEDAGSDKDKAGNIRKYRTAVTGPGEDPDVAEAWCADFASWVWKQAGVPFGKDGRGEDYTVAMIDWAKSQNRYHRRGSYEPKPGDLVMIDWQGGQDVDHVAVVTKVENGRVHTIGGNESDSVKAASYKLDDARMMGFIPPAGG